MAERTSYVYANMAERVQWMLGAFVPPVWILTMRALSSISSFFLATLYVCARVQTRDAMGSVVAGNANASKSAHSHADWHSFVLQKYYNLNELIFFLITSFIHTHVKILPEMIFFFFLFLYLEVFYWQRKCWENTFSFLLKNLV